MLQLVRCLIKRTGLFGRYQKGLAHLQYGEYAQAYSVWLDLAEKGYSQAQFDLGVMLYNAIGVERDYEMALYWLNKSAGQNHARAENYLGTIYMTGVGASQDIDKALRYFKQAAEHGDMNAHANYAALLAGVPRN